jgi:hypothetical protein
MIASLAEMTFGAGHDLARDRPILFQIDSEG